MGVFYSSTEALRANMRQAGEKIVANGKAGELREALIAHVATIRQMLDFEDSDKTVNGIGLAELRETFGSLDLLLSMTNPRSPKGCSELLRYADAVTVLTLTADFLCLDDDAHLPNKPSPAVAVAGLDAVYHRLHDGIHL